MLVGGHSLPQLVAVGCSQQLSRLLFLKPEPQHWKHSGVNKKCSTESRSWSNTSQNITNRF